MSQDLIRFDDHDEKYQANGDNDTALNRHSLVGKSTTASSPQRGKQLPDIRRVLLTEIQYYREPIHVPTYQRDDFLRDTVDSETENDSRTVTTPSVDHDLPSVEISTPDSLPPSDEDEAIPPPLPPRRYKSPSESMHVKHREGDEKFTPPFVAGVVKSTSDPTSLPVVLDPFERVEQFSSPNASTARSDTSDLMSRNLIEFETGFNGVSPDDSAKGTNHTISKKASKEPRDNSSLSIRRCDLKRLSQRDIQVLEGGALELTSPSQLQRSKSIETKSATLPARPLRPLRPKSSQLDEIAKETRPRLSPLTESDYGNEKDIYLESALFQKVEERNEEALAFCNFVARLRNCYKYDDNSTNSGYISATKIRNKTLLHASRDVKIYLETEPKNPRTLHVKLSCTANEIMHQYFRQFHKGDQSYELDIIADKYVLKFVGHATCITDISPLCDFAIVQNCIKHSYEIEFALVRTGGINTDFKRDKTDDTEDCRGTYFKYYFESATSLSISEQGLSILLDAYNNEAANLLKEVSQTHKVVYQPERLIQVVKAISKSLAQVELLTIQDAVNILLALKRVSENTTLQVYNNNRDERRNFNQYINPIYFDKGRFHQALQKLTNGVITLIELYCKAFDTDFQVQNKKIPKCNNHDNADDEIVFERIDPRTITDKFTVRICSIHRIPAVWKHEYHALEIQVALYYGGNLLCAAEKTAPRQIVVGFFEQVRFHELLEFDFPVKSIPRESKVTFTLTGLSQPKKGTDGRTLLGWVSCNAYNFKGMLLSGSNLFGLLSDVNFNPVATCATGYIQKAETVLLKADFQLYHTDVMFPQPVLITPGTLMDTHTLSEGEIEYVKKVLRKDTLLLSSEEKSVIWNGRFSLSNLPHALLHVLVSCPSWDSDSVSKVHAILSTWEALPPIDAVEFLHADFPDKTLRETAVLWLSKISDDELCDYLPELVQALKYEAYHNSALAQFFIKRSLASCRVAHHLFWHLKYYTKDLQFSQRFQIVLSGLLSACGKRFRHEVKKQDSLVKKLSIIARDIKTCKDSRQRYLIKELDDLNENRDDDFPLRLPLDPSIKLSGVLPGKSSFFSSNTVPLKISFRNSDSSGKIINVIYKLGDDLRKDMVTLLMFRVMNKLWLDEGLDLKMMLYDVLPTGPLNGLIEIVPNAATFREIHIRHGLTGSFKDDSLALWLQKYNTSIEQYKRAIDNFTLSAAGYCVATYLLGIGDRHNDNIMLTNNGHLFHIDFSKFMGDVQKFGNINRDRVPFILTPDMAYVINNGLTPTPNFQRFIEYCCRAFNIIRRRMKVFLNLLGLMVYSGIAYLSDKEDLRFIRRNLQLHLTDDEATMYFTRLIESSLSSRTTQLNFFIHNVAQMKNTAEMSLRSSKCSPLFSFSNKTHSAKSDGEIVSARIVDFQKRYIPEKHYVFVINILRAHNNKGPKFVFRRYEDFQELHAKLGFVFNIFSGVLLPELPSRVLIGRSQVREVARRRQAELDQYLVLLSKIEKVWKSDVVCTFFHSYIKDNEEGRRFVDYADLLNEEGTKSRVGGKIKLSISYKNRALYILVMHASGLKPNRIQGLANPFVKSYLLPDPLKYYKRKTRVTRKTLNPTFNETLEYDVAWELLQKRILQITIWDKNSLSENEFLGGIHFYLSTLDGKKPLTGWFDLVDIGLEG